MSALGLFARKKKKAPARRRSKGRRRDVELRRQRRQRLLAIALGIGVGVTAVWWSWSTGYFGRLADQTGRFVDRQIAGIGLAVDNVLVTGRSEVTQAQVVAALGVRSGQSIFNFDPQAARERLVALGWVQDARIERRLPDTIVVHMLERRPLALWQQDGRYQLIDRQGVVITREHLGRFAALPVVIGTDAPANAGGLVDMLALQPELSGLVEAATWIGGRRWDLQMKRGIRVELPEEQPASAWNRLAELVREKQLLERDVVAIDMRIPDRMVVRMTPSSSDKRRAAGKDT